MCLRNLALRLRLWNVKPLFLKTKLEELNMIYIYLARSLWHLRPFPEVFLDYFYVNKEYINYLYANYLNKQLGENDNLVKLDSLHFV